MNSTPPAAIVNFPSEITVSHARSDHAAPRDVEITGSATAPRPVWRGLRSLASRGDRAAPGPQLYRRSLSSYVASDAATRGALSIFVEGARARNSRLTLFGLSVLRSATPHQIGAAILVLEAAGVTDAADVGRLLDCGT